MISCSLLVSAYIYTTQAIRAGPGAVVILPLGHGTKPCSRSNARTKTLNFSATSTTHRYETFDYEVTLPKLRLVVGRLSSIPPGIPRMSARLRSATAVRRALKDMSAGLMSEPTRAFRWFSGHKLVIVLANDPRW